LARELAAFLGVLIDPSATAAGFLVFAIISFSPDFAVSVLPAGVPAGRMLNKKPGLPCEGNPG
jgi:hypothetical protein